MPSSVTLRDVKDEALWLADEASPKSGTAEDKALDRNVNRALTVLYEKLTAVGFDDYSHATSSITLVAGTQDYALPSDFFRCKKVWYLSSSHRFKVDKFNLDEVDGYRSSPLTSGSVELWYYPKCDFLANDKAAMPHWMAPGWEEYLSLFLAAKIMLGERDNIAQVQAERENCLRHIIEAASPRDKGGDEAVADISGRFSGGGFGLPDDRHFKYRLLGNNISFIETDMRGA